MRLRPRTSRTAARPVPRSTGWTRYEVVLVLLSIGLIIVPLAGEIWRWIDPPLAPAAQPQPTDVAAPLRVTGQVAANSIAPGQPVAFSFVVSGDAATPVRVALRMPLGRGAVVQSAQATGGSCSYDAMQIACDVTAGRATDATVTVTLSADAAQPPPALVLQAEALDERNVSARSPALSVAVDGVATAATADPSGPGTPELAPFDVTRDLAFTMTSDWSTVYADQSLTYYVMVMNDHHERVLEEVQLSSILPDSLSVEAAAFAPGYMPASGGVALVSGQHVRALVPRLASGEAIELQIQAVVRTDVAAGDVITAQSQLAFTGVAAPLFSPPVSITVDRPAATPSAVATPSAQALSSKAVPPAASLPETSSGLPWWGIALLAVTLGARALRQRRGRSGPRAVRR